MWIQSCGCLNDLDGVEKVVQEMKGDSSWDTFANLAVDKWNTSKLQRNALSVTEAPTGNEDDDDLDLENTVRNGSNYMTSEDRLKPHKSKLRGQRSSRSSHKTLSRSLSSDSQSKSSAFTPPQNMKVDLSKLKMPALLKYWQHFNLVS
ncbi:hypothetical protein F2Q68_00013685 [Brassica cretica]|uniref:Uncharacterized protein n=1 Tax=Brassica cretica TaxID=69181 RepID=A0A8S9HE08_BRACR|nr:hypothetical protein F2Q68_00013685 [Brassica cretica]